MGLDIYLFNKNEDKRIELDSEKYPQHDIKIGYIRSSYNVDSFDLFLKEKADLMLGDIFGWRPTDNDLSIVFPNWKSSLELAKLVHARIKKKKNATWYIQAVEIVVETIEYVMKQPNSKDYYLSFSY